MPLPTRSPRSSWWPSRRTIRPVVAGAAERALRSRPLVRAPLVLYRVGLGALFGSRMLMLEHTGRQSGLTRRVVLEIVDRPGPDRAVVVAGFGERAQWLRNVRADPRVRVSTGRRRSAPATARGLDRAEAGDVLARYVRDHHRLWSWFAPVVERTLGRPLDAGTAPPPMVEFAVDPRSRHEKTQVTKL